MATTSKWQKFKRFMRKWWWAFLAGFAAVIGILIGTLFRGGGGGGDQKPKFREKAKLEVAKIDAEAKYEKAVAVAEVKAKQAELEKIEKVEDPVERRDELAKFLKDNL
jgi:hypothetical protein